MTRAEIVADLRELAGKDLLRPGSYTMQVAADMLEADAHEAADDYRALAVRLAETAEALSNAVKVVGERICWDGFDEDTAEMFDRRMDMCSLLADPAVRRLMEGR